MDIAAPLNSPFYRNSIIARYYNNTAVFSSRQQHIEVELVYIKGVCGTLVVGDSEIIFTGEPQLIIIGAYLPHVWQISRQRNMKMVVYSFHFNMKMFGELLFLPEMSRVNDLIMTFYKGIEVVAEDANSLEKDVVKLYKGGPAERIISLLNILNKISMMESVKMIVSDKYNLNCTQKDGANLRKIYRYVTDHYDGEISLDDVAKILKITRESFSRYFALKANITFSEYLTETRIGFARQMLLNNSYSTNEISMRCGYKNSSNFFQQFKSICGVSPQAYQKRYC